MNKLLFIVGLVVMTSSVYAVDENVVNDTQDASSSAPAVKPTTAKAAEKQITPAQQAINLETAYKREYAFLTAQKQELSKRLKKYQSSVKGEAQSLNNRINVLERGSVERSASIDQLNIQLAEAERSEAAVSERSDALEITYSQAETALKSHNITIPDFIENTPDIDLIKVGYFFKQALSLLNNQGAIQTTTGHFFLNNGKQIQGDIIRLGSIAAYGVSAEGSGSLVPAGGGDLKMWREPSAESAIALSKNQQPENLKIFLFESRTTAIEESPEKTILSVIDSGGIIGWIIVSLGAIAALLVIIRIYLLRSNSTNTRELSDQVIQQVISGNFDAARKTCAQGSSAITRVLSNTLHHLKDDRDHMESVVHEAILQESGPLDRFGSAILVIASVSPLLGLLGTVTGMIATFDIITEFGTGDPKLLSGGISIALVTTKLGLIIAIPTLLAGSLLSAWAKNIKRDMEHAALRVTNVFLGRPDSENATGFVESDETLMPANSGK